MTNLTTATTCEGQLAGRVETFTCCETPMPWPTRTEDRTCPECGTVWEHDGVDLGAGARIKPEPVPQEAGLAEPAEHYVAAPEPDPATVAVFAAIYERGRADERAAIGGELSPADLDLVRQALADASAWRAWKAEGAGCEDCQRLDPGRCADHAADDELAAAYEALLRRLVVEGAVL